MLQVLGRSLRTIKHLGLELLLVGLTALPATGEASAEGLDGAVSCQAGEARPSALTVSAAGDGGLQVSAGALRWWGSTATAEAEVLKEISWAPDLRLDGGMAETPDSRALAFQDWVSRDALGAPGETVSLHVHFRVPRQPDVNTCSVTFTL